MREWQERKVEGRKGEKEGGAKKERGREKTEKE